MADPHPQGEIPFNPTVVYRALPYENLIRRTGEHKENTFYRHPRRDPDGLSVTTSIAACKAQFQRPIFGIRRVDVAAVRAYGLEFFPDSDSHANIRFPDGTNIPVPGVDDPTGKNIASDLMSMSVPVDHWDAENADEIEATLLNRN